MKKYILSIAIGIFLLMTANSHAGVRFNVIVGGPGYYYYPSGYDGYNYNGYGHYYHHRHSRYWHH